MFSLVPNYAQESLWKRSGDLFEFFIVHTLQCSDFTLTLCSGVTPSRALGTIWHVGDQTWIRHMQDKCASSWTISMPTLTKFLKQP